MRGYQPDSWPLPVPAAMTPFMYPPIRALLFALDAERSHEVALAALRLYGALPGTPRPLAGRPRELFGLAFRNPVGLAAGLDKEARAVLGLARLGFGPCRGRDRDAAATAGQSEAAPVPAAGGARNHQPDGFQQRRGDGDGAPAGGAARGRPPAGHDPRRQRRQEQDTPLERAAADYVACITAVYGSADYLTLNLSSPNTPGLRTLQSGDALGPLLGEIQEAGVRLAQRHGHRVPVLLKIAPDLLQEDVEIIAAAVTRYASTDSSRPIPRSRVRALAPRRWRASPGD